MAPTRTKKRKSTESESSVDLLSFPAPPAQKTIPTKKGTPARTPTSRSPIRKQAMGISVNQKQALIDNLQLEITERARKLRAQYMLQAQGLRTRVEIRINRIPTALRQAKMGDLIAKHSGVMEQTRGAAAASSTTVRRPILPSPSKSRFEEIRSHTRQSPSPTRPAKRTSDEMIDKENEDLSNPKKRAKGAVQQPRPASRAQLKPDQVLSPRSANSRTIPRSPVRPVGSPGKSLLARPISPSKPTAPNLPGGAASMLINMVEKAKTSRATSKRKAPASSSTTATGAGRGKRTVVAAAGSKGAKGRASDISESSETSSGTVVNRTVAAKKAPAKKTVMSTLKSMGAAPPKKPAAPKPPATTTTTTTGRVLRKRN
ncbi:MAG: hypothetical protein M1818_002805 [Claussenomyces sp. TS43310]|nr:MAG: hypothetical protein M1818_002805 [Claussenomyces sp. TS43310]